MNINRNLFRDLRRALASVRLFERTPDGQLYLPKSRVFFGGVFSHTLNGEDLQIDPNIVVNEGLDQLIASALLNQTQLGAWYVSLFRGNVTPADTWTAANYNANATEFVDYTPGTRPVWTGVADAGGARNSGNAAAPAIFTAAGIAAPPTTVYGAGLHSVSTKASTTGKLLAATRFANSRSLTNTDVLGVTYTIQAADAGP